MDRRIYRHFDAKIDFVILDYRDFYFFDYKTSVLGIKNRCFQSNGKNGAAFVDLHAVAVNVISAHKKAQYDCAKEVTVIQLKNTREVYSSIIRQRDSMLMKG